MFFKFYLYLIALRLVPDTQLVRLLCHLVLDIYSVINEILHSATAITAATINAGLKANFEALSGEVIKRKSIQLRQRHIGDCPMTGATVISELRNVFGTTILPLGIGLRSNSLTVG